jgi:hypothetical protein
MVSICIHYTELPKKSVDLVKHSSGRHRPIGKTLDDCKFFLVVKKELASHGPHGWQKPRSADSALAGGAGCGGWRFAGGVRCGVAGE